MSDKTDKGMSRRQFLGLTGGVLGAAALASAGFNINLKKNEREIDLNSVKNKEHESDILVVGGGMTGLFAAVKGHDAGAKVLMVSKGRLGTSGQTPFAKGMFAYDASKESLSLDDFADRVAESALNTSNKVFTKQMAEHSMARVKELREWGFFDKSLCYDSFNKPIKERNIPVKERIMITHLLKENGRIAGAAGFSIDEPTVHVFKAKSVILCTGAGGFKPSGFPICDLTHDGSVMAYRIGAKITGKEWNDGHSGMAENPADCYNGWHDMFERVPGTTGIEVHHDLGVDGNYSGYMKGNPVAGGPGGGAGDVEGGPYRPEGFDHAMPGGEGGEEGGRPSGPPPGGEDGGRPSGSPSRRRGRRKARRSASRR